MELDIDVGARLVALLEGQAERDQRRAALRTRIAGAVLQVPLACPQFQGGGNGTMDYPDALKAKTGYYWSVRRLTLTGWSAGSATAYIDSTAGEPVAPYPAPAVLTFGRGELLLNPDSRLVIACTGITGVVQLNGRADVFPSWMLPYYLGLAEREV